MKIFRGLVEIYDLVIDSQTKLEKRLMAEDLITLRVTTSSPLDLRVGDYTTLNGINYEINRPAKFKKTSDVEYNYEVQMEGTIYRLLDKLVQLNGKIEFYLTGSCADFINLIIDNINTIDTGWTKGTAIDDGLDTNWRTLYVNAQSCKQFMDTIASEFSGESVVVNKEISIVERVEHTTDLTFEVGKGKGLYELSRDSVDKENTVTRVFVYGSTRNIPTDYRNGEKRLIFHNPITLTNSLEDTSEYSKIVEKTVTFEGIYPRFTGTIGTVSADVLTISCPLMDFDLNEQLLPDTTAKVVFLSGDLMGQTIEVSKFDNVSNGLTLKPLTTGIIGTPIYPSAAFPPAAGDKFTFIDIKMPDSYIVNAEATLKLMGEKWLAYYSKARVKYTLTLDARYIRDSAISLHIGDIVTIIDSELGINSEIRITALSMSLDGKEITAEISNYKDEIWEKGINAALTDTIQKLTEAAAAAAAAGDNINNLNETFNNFNPGFDQITGLPKDNAALVAYLNSIGANKLVDVSSAIISGAIVWDQGLTYKATDINYKILGVTYTAQAKDIPLEAADANLSRIDTIYVDIFGNLEVATGTPAINPIGTILNSAYQLEVITVRIGPGALVPENVDITTVYNENIEWTTSATADTYVTIDFESLVEPLNGTKRIAIKIAVSNEALNAPLHFIGENYQGGRIFWLSTDGKKGLIAAVEDTALSAIYSRLSGSSNYSTGATGKAIGTGQSNSTLMLANSAAAGGAVKFCDEFTIDGFDDWFLPSEDELIALHFRRYEVGNFANKTYWSSREWDWQQAVCISFSDGAAHISKKNNSFSVRAIRAFDDTAVEPGSLIDSLTTTATKLTFAHTEALPVNEAILSLFIKSSKAWKVNSMLLIESFLGATKTGSVVISPATNLYGYKPADAGWQMIAVSLNRFATTRTTIDGFKISLAGSWLNNFELGIDDIRFQYSSIVAAKDEPANKTDYHFVENPDGVRVEFTTSSPYVPGSTQVSKNGIRQICGAGQDYTETDGKIIFAIAPKSTAGLICDYKTTG